MPVTFIQSGRFGAAFSPLDLSPAAWFDASDSGSITESGGAVSQWNDKSGVGNHVNGADFRDFGYHVPVAANH